MHTCVIVHTICIIYEDRHQRADTGGLCEGTLVVCVKGMLGFVLKKSFLVP